MVFRPSTKLAAKLHVELGPVLPLARNPFVDWSARVFTADRLQYILLTNTASLYSVVFRGRGVTNSEAFHERVMRSLSGHLRRDDFRPVYDQYIGPEAWTVLYSGPLNRSVTGSMNDLVARAQYHLAELGWSTEETSFYLNDTPLSRHDRRGPRAAFEALRPRLRLV